MAGIGIFLGNRLQAPRPLMPVAPTVEASPLRVALYSASRVYGRKNCGDYVLADLTARYAVRNGLDGGLFAAIIAVESSCDPLAIGRDGEVGLKQIRISTGRKRWDFRRENPLDPETNLRMGTTLLGELVKQHGAQEGLVRFNGDGPEARVYAKKVMELTR